MKVIIENFRMFLAEQDFVSEIPLEIDEDGNVILYHISSVEDIEILDPDIAARNIKDYTSKEYRTWSRPRVFFFTRLGQKDTGIGKIQGVPYEVKIKPSQLYPINKDPGNLFNKHELQNWMLENVPEFSERAKNAEKCSSDGDYNQWHLCSKTPNSEGLLFTDEGLMGKRFLVDSGRFHSDKPNRFELVAKLAEARYGSIGFIYPQSNDKNNIIVALWRKVPAKRLNKDFY